MEDTGNDKRANKDPMDIFRRLGRSFQSLGYDIKTNYFTGKAIQLI